MSKEGGERAYDFQDWTPVVIRNSQVAKNAKQQKQNLAGTKEFIKLNKIINVPDDALARRI
jgi:hypothetical protein